MRNKRTAATARAVIAIAGVTAKAAAVIGAAIARLGAMRYGVQTCPGIRDGCNRGTRGVERAVFDQWLMWRK